MLEIVTTDDQRYALPGQRLDLFKLFLLTVETGHGQWVVQQNQAGQAAQHTWHTSSSIRPTRPLAQRLRKIKPRFLRGRKRGLCETHILKTQGSPLARTNAPTQIYVAIKVASKRARTPSTPPGSDKSNSGCWMLNTAGPMYFSGRFGCRGMRWKCK